MILKSADVVDGVVVLPRYPDILEVLDVSGVISFIYADYNHDGVVQKFNVHWASVGGLLDERWFYVGSVKRDNGLFILFLEGQ